MEGYSSYAFMNDGKLVRLEFHDDLVRDKDVQGITPDEKKYKDIEFMPRGNNNDLCLGLLKEIWDNVTLSSNVDFKTKVVYGDGIHVYRKKRDESGKIVCEEVLESEAPEIFEFLERTEYDTIRFDLANNLMVYNDAYIEYIFNREDKPKVVKLQVRDTNYSLISKIDKKSGKSEYHGYCTGWSKQDFEDLVVTPLLDKRYPLTDMLMRMGLIENEDGKLERTKDRRFVQNLMVPTPGRWYYNRPYWWSVISSGWTGLANAIPKYKKALLTNQMAPRSIVYIKDTFWEKLFRETNATKAEEKEQQKKQFLDKLEQYLAGEENAGRTLVVNFRYNGAKALEDKDVIFQQLQDNLKGGEYIEDSEEASNTLSYGMGVHPSIIGSSPGKNKSINGTEARELFMITQALHKVYQDAILKPLYMVKKINGWPEDIYFSTVNLQLVTLDQNSGAKKNKGIEEKEE